MSKQGLVALTAATLMGASALAGGASAAPSGGQLIFGVDRPGDAVSLDKAQYFWGGRNYCFYDGWNGPGYYWCGYGWRRGYGWGGGYGWHGWRGGWHDGGYHGGWHGGGWRHGGDWHGGHGDWHDGGGGWHGGHGGGGGWHDGGGHHH